MRVKEALRSLLPRTLKLHRIRSGPLRGASIYTSWHDYPGAIRGTTEARLLQWFAQHVKPGQTWLDIGAHYGYTALALSRLVGPQGRVFAFEPVAATAACIEQTRAANSLENLRVCACGLGNSALPQTIRLPLTRGMADSTLGGEQPSESISVAKFDDLWNTLSNGEPGLHGVKIDVQGMEEAVLAGMEQALTKWRPLLVVEFHAGANREAILELLARCGYDREPRPVEACGLPRGTLANDTSYAFFPAVFEASIAGASSI